MVSRRRVPKKLVPFRSRIIGLTGIVLVALILVTGVSFGCAQAPAEKPVEVLTLVSGWPAGDMGNFWLDKFIERLNKEATSVRIDYKGGTEIVPPFEGLAYVSKGSIDLWHTTPPYYAGGIPVALGALNIVASQSAQRESGFWDLFDKIHREKANVTALGQLWRGDPIGLFLNKRTDKADFTGMKIRSTPLTDAGLRSLGASLVTLPPAEIYSALQTGVVDGFVFPYGPGFIENKWYEVVSYAVNPTFPHETCGDLLANLDRWNALPEKPKKEIMDLMLELEPQVYDWYKTEAVKAIDVAVKEGNLEIMELPPQEAEKFVKVTKEGLWDTIIKLDPEYGPILKDLAIQTEEAAR